MWSGCPVGCEPGRAGDTGAPFWGPPKTRRWFSGRSRVRINFRSPIQKAIKRHFFGPELPFISGKSDDSDRFLKRCPEIRQKTRPSQKPVFNSGSDWQSGRFTWEFIVCLSGPGEVEPARLRGLRVQLLPISYKNFCERIISDRVDPFSGRCSPRSAGCLHGRTSSLPESGEGGEGVLPRPYF